MNDQISIWLPPLLTLLGTLIVVVFTAWQSSRAVMAEIATLRAETKAGFAELELRLTKQISELAGRIKTLEERAGVIYRP